MREALRNKDARQYSRFDGDFHQTLFSLAANPYLTAAGQAFSAKVAAVRNRLGAQPEHMAKSYAEHVELLALLERAEVGLAVDLLERHIRYKGESFWSVPDTAPKSRWERILELSE